MKLFSSQIIAIYLVYMINVILNFKESDVPYQAISVPYPGENTQKRSVE